MTATGAAVNVAQRLRQSAPAGAILVSHDTYRHVRGIFDVRELELQDERGRAEPVRTYIVERAKPRAFRVRTRGVEGVETRMVGPAVGTGADERRAASGRRRPRGYGRHVVGDAGLGKSRLLYEFSNEVELLAERVNVFRGARASGRAGCPTRSSATCSRSAFVFRTATAPAVAREKLERGMAGRGATVTAPKR